MSTDSLPELPHYQPTRFRPDGGFDPAGLFVLVFGMAAAALLMGGIAYWVSQFIYLVLLFPIVIGFAIGIVGVKIIKKARIRNMALVILFGFLAGVLSMGAMHYLGFLEYQKLFSSVSGEGQKFLSLPPEEQQDIMAKASETDREDLKFFIGSHQASQSFLGYLDYQAKQGVRIGRVSQKGTSLGYTGSIIYWIIETCIVAGMVVFLVRDAVGQPFCIRCQVWKDQKGGFQWSADVNQVKTALETGNLPEITKSILVDSQTPSATAKLLSLEPYTCGKCHTMSSTEIFLAVLTPDKHGNLQPSVKSKMTYPGNAQNDLKKITDHLENLAKAAPAEKPTT